MTPMLESDELPRRAMSESCAFMQYLCDRYGLERFYPADPERRAMLDSAMFYLTGTLYPLVARATYPALGFADCPGEIGASDASPQEKEKGRKAAEDAIAEPLEVIRSFYLDGGNFLGGAEPSIADMRFAATLEFLRAIDALGRAYMEPAVDVRGYIQFVTQQRRSSRNS